MLKSWQKKQVKVYPNERALFQLLVVSDKQGIHKRFKLAPGLNDMVPFNKTSDGIYCFKKHLHVMRWFFHHYRRHISEVVIKTLYNYYPEIIETMLGVEILPSVDVSLAKYREHFYKKHAGRLMEVFPSSPPDESEINNNFYEIRVSNEGQMLTEHYCCMVHKREYDEWKRKHGDDFPFVITKINHLKVS